MSKTVAFIYGFTEGNWHGSRFRTALEKEGFRLVDDPKKADVIIAHSGGCYYVPIDLSPSQLVILINPTYWPGRSLARRSLTMIGQLIWAVRPGNEPLFQLRKTMHNIGYLFWHADTNHAMVSHAKKYQLPAETAHPRTILIRNRHDPWLTPDLEHLKRLSPHLQVQKLPGGHDDCWQNPQPYINLIQSVYG